MFWTDSDQGCVGWNACRELTNGEIMFNSCVGPQTCAGLEGIVHEQSCHGTSSCKNAGSDSRIGRSSCLGNFACANNEAEIGDCTCNSNNACVSNTSPVASEPDFCPSEVSRNLYICSFFRVFLSQLSLLPD